MNDRGHYYKFLHLPADVEKKLRESTTAAGISLVAGVGAVIRFGPDVRLRVLGGLISSYFRFLDRTTKKADRAGRRADAEAYLVDQVMLSAVQGLVGPKFGVFPVHVLEADRVLVKAGADQFSIRIGAAGTALLLEAADDIPGSIAGGLGTAME